METCMSINKNHIKWGKCRGHICERKKHQICST